MDAEHRGETRKKADLGGIEESKSHPASHILYTYSSLCKLSVMQGDM
jgi:hypothetical protein